MPERPPSSSAPAADSRWLAWGLVAVTGIVFWPVTRWIVTQAAAREQVKQGMILLLAATALLIWTNRRQLRLAPDLGTRAFALLAGAFACVGLAEITGWSLLLLPGMALALGGSLHVLLGETSYRLLRPLVAGVAALMVIILVFPLLDWPLRQLAGGGAAQVLHFLGLAPRLSVINPGHDQQLILQVGSHAFRVATECNGFGVITSGAMLALLAGGISRRSPWLVALLVLVALPIGFIVNLVRILIITQLAPFFPGHYLAMHNTVGTIMLWVGLGFIGWLAWRPDASVLPPPAPPANV